MLEIRSINEIEFITTEEYLKSEQSLFIETRGKIGTIKFLKIYVYSKEGENVPHFHINKIDKSRCCIEIKHNKYFEHDGDEKLSKKELKLLVEFLKSKNKNGETYWKSLIREWNKGKSKILDENIEMPNYIEIE